MKFKLTLIFLSCAINLHSSQTTTLIPNKNLDYSKLKSFLKEHSAKLTPIKTRENQDTLKSNPSNAIILYKPSEGGYKPLFKEKENNPFAKIKTLCKNFYKEAQQIPPIKNNINQIKMLNQKTRKDFLNLAQESIKELTTCSDIESLAYGPFLNINKFATKFTLNNLLAESYLGFAHQESIFQDKNDYSYQDLYLDRNTQYYLKTNNQKLTIKTIGKNKNKRITHSFEIPYAEKIKILDFSSQNNKGLLLIKKAKKQYTVQLFELIKKNNYEMGLRVSQEIKLQNKPNKGKLATKKDYFALVYKKDIKIYIHDGTTWNENISIDLEKKIDPSISIYFALQDSALILNKPSYGTAILTLLDEHPIITSETTHITENQYQTYTLIASAKELTLFKNPTEENKLNYKKICTWEKTIQSNDIVYIAGGKNPTDLPIIFICEQSKQICSRYDIEKKNGTLSLTSMISLPEQIDQFITNAHGSFATIQTEDEKLLHWNTLKNSPLPFFIKNAYDIQYMRFHGKHLFVSYPNTISIYGNNNKVSPITYLFLLLAAETGGNFHFPAKADSTSWLDFYLPMVNNELISLQSANKFAIYKDNEEKVLKLISNK